MTAHKKENLKVCLQYFRNPESVRSILDQIAIDEPRAKQLSEKDHWDLKLLEQLQR